MPALLQCLASCNLTFIPPQDSCESLFGWFYTYIMVQKATQGSKENHSPKMKSEFLQDVSGDLSQSYDSYTLISQITSSLKEHI